MNVDTKKNGKPNPDTGAEDSAPDRVLLNRVREILQVFGHAVSAVKIYPFDHANVRQFLDDLADKLTLFLEENLELEIGIEEFQFTFLGIPVYEDRQPMKSLPFFFYKDGMQSLIFDKGLDKEELKNLLDVIKTVAQLPPEEGDIVNALWERDFANVRYVAPDEFLESKITAGRSSVESHLKVNREELFSGRIDILPEDRQEMVDSQFLLRAKSPQGAPADGREDLESLETSVQSSLLAEDDLAALETIIQANRRISAEEEFVNVVVEIIYLEDRKDAFAGLFDTLKQSHQELIGRQIFSKALLLIDQLKEMKNIFSRSGSPKADIISDFLKYLVSDEALDELKNSYLKAKESISQEEFFQYISALAPESWKILADLYESGARPDLRGRILNYFQEAGRQDLNGLVSLVLDSRPQLTREIINIVSLSQDKKAVSYLASFLRSAKKQLRLEAVRGLSDQDNSAAQNILLKLLGDEDEEMRMAVAAGLRLQAAPKAVGRIIDIISAKDFHKKSQKEKRALLSCLGRSRTAEACGFLRQLLKKRIVFNRRRLETHLCAVSALEVMGTPDAVRILEEGAKSGNKKIGEACLASLQAVSRKLSDPHPSGERAS